MKHQGHGGAMIETLESRRLLSASVATITADLTKLKTDAETERTAVKTLETDLLSSITTGTAGLSALVADIKVIHTYIQTEKPLLTADLAAVVADAGHPTKKAAALATLTTDVNKFQTKLETDVTAVNAVITKHPTLISADAQLTTDEAAVKADYQTIKADFTQLKADL
jgi:hypothetical protein